ncbi:MAG: NTP transferase domain-containing protein [Theionarchaea archaeon]|nr:NTP transferase domain-containing protein [Theionarchaea archaeon]
MKAVIIAAGKGSRFNSEQPKPLTSLLGLSLIGRVILSAKKAGITEFVIVTGNKAELLKKRIGGGGKYDVTILYVHNSNWRMGNGISVLKAEEIVGRENFLLLMADHVFDLKMLKILCSKNLEKNGCILCIDKNLEDIDFEEATKVLVRNGLIEDIGKTIQTYNGVDCGAFLCSPAVFEAIRTSLSHGEDTLTDGVKILCDKNKVRAADVTGVSWQDIDTQENLRAAEEMLLKSLKKKTDGLIAKAINRRFSLRISKYVSRFGINPNELSVFCFLLGVISGGLFAFQNFILGGVLAQAASVFDGVDGEIARLTMRESRYGGFLDSILDRYADAFIILGMTYAIYMERGGLWVWLGGCLALIGSPMSMLAREKYHAMTGHKYLLKYDRRSRFIPATRDVRLFVVMLGGILHQPLIALMVIAVITNMKAYLRLVDMRETISEGPRKTTSIPIV